MSNTYIVSGILVASIATLLTRILPFLIFNKRERPSPALLLFERFMPLMIMVVLVFYTVREAKFLDAPYGIPEFIGIISVIILHKKYKNVLFSIITSTVIYMLLIQLIIPYLRYQL